MTLNVLIFYFPKQFPVSADPMEMVEVLYNPILLFMMRSKSLKMSGCYNISLMYLCRVTHTYACIDHLV